MKKVFLTGASSGIGLATAQALVAHGHEVWGTSRDVKRLPSLPHFHPAAIDLADPQSIATAFARAADEAGHFDVVINNAGSGHFGPGESLSEKEVAAQFQLLVFGPIQILQAAVHSMQKQEEGLIINVTSLAARLPVPYMAAYNAAKAAMASFTMTLQLELSDRKIRLVDVQPADICTNFNDAVLKTSPADPTSRLEKTWEIVARNLQTAPPPELVAKRVLKLIGERHPPPRVTIGNFFQAAFAPAIDRLLPQHVRIWGLRNYYGL